MTYLHVGAIKELSVTNLNKDEKKDTKRSKTCALI